MVLVSIRFLSVSGVEDWQAANNKVNNMASENLFIIQIIKCLRSYGNKFGLPKGAFFIEGGGIPLLRPYEQVIGWGIN